MSDSNHQMKYEAKPVRPCVTKARLRRLADEVVCAVVSSRAMAAASLQVVGASIALCEHLTSRGEASSLLTQAEFVGLLAKRGAFGAEAASLIDALMLLGVVSQQDGGYRVPAFEAALASYETKMSNRSAGWGKRNQPAAAAKASPRSGRPSAIDPMPEAALQRPENAHPAVAGDEAQQALFAGEVVARPQGPIKRGEARKFGPNEKHVFAADEVVVASIPCDCGGEALIMSSYIKDLAATFKRVDVTEQVLLAASWSNSNPTRRKELRGIRRFLNSWLNEASQRSSVRDAVIRTGNQRNGFGAGAVADLQPAAVGHSVDFSDLDVNESLSATIPASCATPTLIAARSQEEAPVQRATSRFGQFARRHANHAS